jgi:chondroitin 4-sulfotransferase 11
VSLRQFLGGVYRTYSPAKLQPVFDCMRASRHWRKSQIIFVHNPKVAGVAISKSLYGQTLGHIAASDIQKLKPQLFASSFVIGFCRNPVDRFFSAYRFATQNPDVVARSPGFPVDQTAWSTVAGLLDWLACQDLAKVNYIFRPQTYYLCDANGKVLVDYLGRHESFASDISKIESACDRKLSIEIANASRRDDNVIKPDVEIVRQIQDIYAADFSNFHYDSLSEASEVSRPLAPSEE